MYRQGDLMMVAAPERIAAPEHLVANGIVELGAATGHAHRLIDGDVYDLYGSKFLISDGAATLVHEEHKTITLPEGTYRVVRQRQHEGEEQWSNVVD